MALYRFSVRKNNTRPVTKLTLNDTKYSKNEAKIIALLSDIDEAKAKDLANLAGLSLSTVKGALYKLMEKGVMSSKGLIKDKRYFLSKST